MSVRDVLSVFIIWEFFSGGFALSILTLPLYIFGYSVESVPRD